MKLLTEVETPSELLSVSSLMEGNGIPVHIKSASFRLSYRQLIYVFYDAQYHDAISLLANPRHEVENPIDMQEFNALRERLDLDIILKGTFKVLAIVVASFIAIVYLFHRFGTVA